MPDAPQEISLLDSLDGEWIKLLVAPMVDVGPAAQTLGGLLRITSSQTFRPVSDIALAARVPARTVEKHLVALHKAGWIMDKKRQPLKNGWLRRTATIALTKKTLDALRPDVSLDGKRELSYGLLPWWACCSQTVKGKVKMQVPWCARAVLSIVMARLASLKKAVEDQDGKGLSTDDLEGSIENMGGDNRFKFTLERLTKYTGLTRESVVIAKSLLNHNFHILCWQGDEPRKGIQTPPDYLLPNWDFRVLVTAASEGKCHVEFR